MSTVLDVPKPDNPGPAQIAIANTRLSFANIRSGPSTSFRDIGDLRDNSLVVYYPQTRTSDSWYFVEYQGISGWVAGSVVEFEAAVGPNPDQVETPYDGKTAVWHWRGDAIPETTIEQFAANVRRLTPNVKQIWVKTSDGPFFQGTFDTSGPMAVLGVADVDRWVAILSQYDLEFHAWCVPTGVNIDQEAAVISAVCQRPGVMSMILDVEPFQGFWQGGRDLIRPMMLRIRQAVGGSFHIAMSTDSRPQHFDSIFPQEWFPFVNSVHPQTYWATFRQTPEQALQTTFDVWGSYGRPVFPVLQGDAILSEQQAAHTLSTQRHGARGLSWWRYGVISQFSAVNLPVEVTDPGENPENPGENFTDEVIVVPRGEGFRSGSYTGQNEFNQFDGTWNWPVLYKETVPRVSTVWAEWRTELPVSGRYEISTFVPARNATTRRARFKVHGIRGTTTETVIDINQFQNRNRWVSLGIFDIEKDAPQAGKVFLNDVTGETSQSIAFDAIRFRRLVVTEVPDAPEPPDNNNEDWIINGVYIADGYDSPVGTVSQRQGDRVWPSGWRDATGFGNNTATIYVQTFRSYHTGVDLNVGAGGNDDIGVAVYAPASGIVSFQNEVSPWGNLTVIRHDPLRGLNGLVTYSRYGHMQNVIVQPGQRVRRGEKIGEIGTGGGRYIAHLHYDISPTTTLETRPNDWPGLDISRLLATYTDPLTFTRSNRPDVSRR